MKHFLIFILITFPFVSFSQKGTFSIRYLSYTGHPVFEGRMPAKNNPRVVIDDSTFQQIIGKDTISYSITKKVDENYFKATDGLKDFIIKITRQNIGKWKHSIRIEDGEIVTTYLTID